MNYCSEPLAMMAIPTAEPPLPSIARQATGLARSAAAVTRDLGRKVDGAELDRRLAICRACDHYRPSDGKCGKMTGCGCVVAAKARYRALHCPLKPPKW